MPGFAPSGAFAGATRNRRSSCDAGRRRGRRRFGTRWPAPASRAGAAPRHARAVPDELPRGTGIAPRSKRLSAEPRSSAGCVRGRRRVEPQSPTAGRGGARSCRSSASPPCGVPHVRGQSGSPMPDDERPYRPGRLSSRGFGEKSDAGPPAGADPPGCAGKRGTRVAPCRPRRMIGGDRPAVCGGGSGAPAGVAETVRREAVMDEKALAGLVGRLTLEQKVALLTGEDFWSLRGGPGDRAAQDPAVRRARRRARHHVGRARHRHCCSRTRRRWPPRGIPARCGVLER